MYPLLILKDNAKIVNNPVRRMSRTDLPKGLTQNMSENFSRKVGVPVAPVFGQLLFERFHTLKPLFRTLIG